MLVVQEGRPPARLARCATDSARPLCARRPCAGKSLIHGLLGKEMLVELITRWRSSNISQIKALASNTFQLENGNLDWIAQDASPRRAP